MFRPVATRWFEVLCPRGESVRTLAELARTGAIEIECRDRVTADPLLRHLTTGLSEYESLLARYGRYWERAAWRHTPLVESPEVVLERALARIHAWQVEADPLIDLLQSCEEELIRLKWLAEVVGRLTDARLDFAALIHGGPVLGSFCAILPAAADPRLPDWTLQRRIPWEGEHCLIILGPCERLPEVKRQVQAVKGRLIERPAWLTGNAREALARIGARRTFLSSRRFYLYAELDTLFDDEDLGDALGEVSGLSWFARHVGALEPASRNLVWITGWTPDLSGKTLHTALEQARTRALLRLTSSPPGKHPPRILVNPAWMRPFERFTLALGVPDADEVDPTPLLALLVPLLFGYMFGDLGQGALLLALGLWLQPRLPIARLLVAGGIAAMVFGLLFGSLFALEDLITPLWMHPLEDPITLLTVPLVFAVGLLALGQLLAGLSAFWCGAARHWLLQDLGLLILYLGLIAWPFAPELVWLPLLGLGWSLLGILLNQRSLPGGLAALGHLLESGMQLLVNTISFARVGAFALAHASLSAAVVTMAEAAPDWAWLVILVLGNLLILALEGLVVSIQTTRLVLFEFFNRFLRATGRVFRPLPAPPAVVQAIEPRPVGYEMFVDWFDRAGNQ